MSTRSLEAKRKAYGKTMRRVTEAQEAMRKAAKEYVAAEKRMARALTIFLEAREAA